MNIIIDLGDYLTVNDFHNRQNLETLITKSLSKRKTDEGHLMVDRPTHSEAIEFFKILYQDDETLMVKHLGGIN